jgi:hypothetical protein
VQGFFELFATVLVAIMFHQMGVVSTETATRLIYRDAILYLSGGIIGTGDHWDFTGQGTLNMGLASCFSALEVVPLTLLTLDAWDFIKLRKTQCSASGHDLAAMVVWQSMLRNGVMPKGPSILTRVPSGTALKTHLKAVSRMRVATIRSGSWGALASEKVRVLPSGSVCGGSMSIRSID